MPMPNEVKCSIIPYNASLLIANNLWMPDGDFLLRCYYAPFDSTKTRTTIASLTSNIVNQQSPLLKLTTRIVPTVIV